MFTHADICSIAIFSLEGSACECLPRRIFWDCTGNISHQNYLTLQGISWRGCAVSESRDIVGKAPFNALVLCPCFLLDAFLGLIEMTKKQPCFALNTKSIIERIGSYKSSSWSAMSNCLLQNLLNGPSCIFVGFRNIKTVRHIIGPWHRSLMPPIAYVLRDWAQRGTFAE